MEPIQQKQQIQQTVKNFKADGTEITEPEIQKTHTVEKGESITSIIKNALAEQGITEPTAEQLTNAKKEFLELNKDIVKTYNGKNTQWKGNKFFYPNDVVKIPNFTKTTETQASTQDDEESDIDAINLPEVVIIAKRPTEETIARKKELQEKLGADYIVEYDKEGKIVVKDKDDNILPEATKRANNPDDQTIDNEDVELMMTFDSDNNKAIDENEYTKFLTELLQEANIQITDSNRDEIMKLIKESFISMDTINKDKLLTKEELIQNAETVINNLSTKIINTLDNN